MHSRRLPIKVGNGLATGFPGERRMRYLILLLLKTYKWALSPLLPPACRYVPTCSEYAMEAIERHGSLRGTLMALWRLLRCHPLAGGGYDPVVPPSKPAVSANLSNGKTA